MRQENRRDVEQEPEEPAQSPRRSHINILLKAGVVTGTVKNRTVLAPKEVLANKTVQSTDEYMRYRSWSRSLSGYFGGAPVVRVSGLANLSSFRDHRVWDETICHPRRE